MLKDMALCHLSENVVINMVKNNEYCNKNRNRCCKNSKIVFQKTAEASGDLIGNKIAHKIPSLGKAKEGDKTKKMEEIYIRPEKREQIIDDLNLF